MNLDPKKREPPDAKPQKTAADEYSVISDFFIVSAHIKIK